MENENHSRRSVLQRTLAFACCLGLPVRLFSTTSAFAETEIAQASDAKVTQSVAQYQAKPKAGHSCGGCTNFITASNSCKKVDGQISPEGWCLFWTKKA